MGTFLIIFGFVMFFLIGFSIGQDVERVRKAREELEREIRKLKYYNSH